MKSFSSSSLCSSHSSSIFSLPIQKQHKSKKDFSNFLHNNHKLKMIVNDHLNSRFDKSSENFETDTNNKDSAFSSCDDVCSNRIFNSYSDLNSSCYQNKDPKSFRKGVTMEAAGTGGEVLVKGNKRNTFSSMVFESCDIDQLPYITDLNETVYLDADHSLRLKKASQLERQDEGGSDINQSLTVHFEECVLQTRNDETHLVKEETRKRESFLLEFLKRDSNAGFESERKDEGFSFSIANNNNTDHCSSNLKAKNVSSTATNTRKHFQKNHSNKSLNKILSLKQQFYRSLSSSSLFSGPSEGISVDSSNPVCTNTCDLTNIDQLVSLNPISSPVNHHSSMFKFFHPFTSSSPILMSPVKKCDIEDHCVSSSQTTLFTTAKGKSSNVNRLKKFSSLTSLFTPSQTSNLNSSTSACRQNKSNNSFVVDKDKTKKTQTMITQKTAPHQRQNVSHKIKSTALMKYIVKNHKFHSKSRDHHHLYDTCDNHVDDDTEINIYAHRHHHKESRLTKQSSSTTNPSFPLNSDICTTAHLHNDTPDEDILNSRSSLRI